MVFDGSSAIDMALPAELSRSQNSQQPESGRFFRGANRAVLPEPIAEAHRCNLRPVTPRTLQKALCVGVSESGRLLQVVCLGGSQFPVPEARLARQTTVCCLAVVEKSTALRIVSLSWKEQFTPANQANRR